MESSILSVIRDQYRYEHARRASALRMANTGKFKEVLTTCNYLRDTYKMSAYGSVSSGYIGLSISIHELEGLKDEQLAKLLTSLLGHEPDKEETQDYPGAYNRDYRFHWKTTEGHTGFETILMVTICAYFKSDSETCKRVIVGYRDLPKEPEPIYALRCSDEAQPEPVTAEAPYISPSVDGY